MRVLGHFAAILCVCGILASIPGFAQAPPPAASQAPIAQAAAERAAKVLADARAALGGEAKIAAVRNFTTTGRTRRVQGDNLVPIEFEMAVELPDKYIRKDEIPAQESDPTTQGFNGDALIQLPPLAPPAPRPGMPPPPAAQFENMLKQRVVTVKQDFARLMLGMFASSYAAYPLTFAYVGQAEAPEGKADVLDATGPNNFKVRLFINSTTHLPIMVSWTAAARPPMPGRMGGPEAGAVRGAVPPAGERGAAPAAPVPAAPTAPVSGAPSAPVSGASSAAGQPKPPAESRLYFSDYREVDGLQLPFRLRRGVGTETNEETTFDRFRINTKIDPRRFEVRTPKVEVNAPQGEVKK